MAPMMMVREPIRMSFSESFVLRSLTAQMSEDIEMDVCLGLTL